MVSASACTIVLCGKSTVEMQIAKSIKCNSTLKLPNSCKASILLRSEVQESGMGFCFGFDSFMNRLETSCFGRLLLWSPRLHSTHEILSLNFSDVPLGTVCIADAQFGGRGRSENVWQSPLGCLMFSFTLKMEDGGLVPLLQYVVSLALAEALNDLCDINGVPLIDIKIKWPNDLYLDGLKVGGILCTSKYREKMFNVSIGIGLNVDNDTPTTCLNAQSRNFATGTYKFTREDILASFFNKFECFFDTFINKGFKPLEELYYKRWMHSGQRVTVQEHNEDQMVERVATVQGLTPSGYLLAVADDDQMCELHPDGNSFDFFKGLVKRKLS